MSLESIDFIVKSLTAIFGSLVLLFGAMKTYEAAKNVKKPPPTAYSELEKRVIVLEKSDTENTREISRLQSQVYALSGLLLREVNTVLNWYLTGKMPPDPDREVEAINEVIEELRQSMSK